MSNSPVDLANLDSLKDIIGEDLKEVLLTFIEVAPTRVTDMMLAIEVGDKDDLQLKAHTLKGSASTVGAHTLANLCDEVERACKTVPPINLNGLTAPVAQISAALHEVLTSLNAYVKNF